MELFKVLTALGMKIKTMKRSKNRVIAEHTLKILEQGYYFDKNGNGKRISDYQEQAEKGTEFWPAAKLDELLKKPLSGEIFETSYSVINDTTLNAVRSLLDNGLATPEELLCLNFASAKNPGGGFLNGSQAQEESIARASGLYPCLLNAPEYYTTHRAMKSCIYTDSMIFSPLVPIFKDEDGEPCDEVYLASVITSAAVNAGVVRRQEAKNAHLILPSMKVRIEKLLALCAEKKQKVLVLGAWGCGVFQNNPAEVALLFKEVLDEKFATVFKHICFAIYSKEESFIKPFIQAFKI